MGTSRYDRFSEVGDREYQESRALHIVADLVRDYPGVEASPCAAPSARSSARSRSNSATVNPYPWAYAEPS